MLMRRGGQQRILKREIRFGEFIVPQIPAVRFLQPGREIDGLMPIERALDRRQRIFQPGGAIEQHGLLAARHAAVGEALFVSRVSGGAFGA